MGSLLSLGALAMIAVDAVVGVRLLLMAARTRELPEFALGVAFVLLGAIGYPLTTAARRGLLPSDDANQALMAAGLLAQDVACFAVYLQTAYTFHAGRPWATVLLAAAGAIFAGSWLGHALANGFVPNETCAPYWLGLAARAGAFGWTSQTALREYQLARRRQRIGLVAPIVANRFLLFALGTGGVFAAFVTFTIGQLTTENVSEELWVLAATGTAGLFAAIPTWLAFLPPKAYRRRFELEALAKERA